MKKEAASHHALKTLGALLVGGDGDSRGHVIHKHNLEASRDLLLHAVVEGEAGREQQVLNRGVGCKLQLANELVELKDDVNKPGQVLRGEIRRNEVRRSKTRGSTQRQVT